MKTIRVRDAFHVSGRDCLTIVGDQDMPVRRGETFESNRGVRVRVVALVTLTRSDGVDRAVCVEPKDADLRAGDVLIQTELGAC